MSSVTSPIMLDSTGKLIAEAVERQNVLLAEMITSSGATSAAALREIHEIVRSGNAADTFSIGDQILLNYNDGTNSYVLPWDIVHFDNVTLMDGEVVPGMTEAQVKLSYGPPPAIRTPDLRNDTWFYWLTPSETLRVIFRGGKVRNMLNINPR